MVGILFGKSYPISSFGMDWPGIFFCKIPELNQSDWSQYGSIEKVFLNVSMIMEDLVVWDDFSTHQYPTWVTYFWIFYRGNIGRGTSLRRDRVWSIGSTGRLFMVDIYGINYSVNIPVPWILWDTCQHLGLFTHCYIQLNTYDRYRVLACLNL